MKSMSLWSKQQAYWHRTKLGKERRIMSFFVDIKCKNSTGALGGDGYPLRKRRSQTRLHSWCFGTCSII